MKQRVKQIGEVYYPQYREWFVWRHHQRAVGGTVCGIAYEVVKFETLAKAAGYCMDQSVNITEVK